MKYVDRFIISLLAAILIFSAFDKILHYQGFLNALLDYVLVPVNSTTILAPAVITAEIVVGIGLLVRLWRRQAAFAAAFLFLIFTAAVALNYVLGGRGICGCWFTITLAQSTEHHIAQNLLMAGLALSLALSHTEEASAGETSPASLAESA